jgi:hypothetical protein
MSTVREIIEERSSGLELVIIVAALAAGRIRT